MAQRVADRSAEGRATETPRLLCEGDERSPDAPILRAILHGLPIEVRPSLSRGALLRALEGAGDAAREEERHGDIDRSGAIVPPESDAPAGPRAVMALRDGDFPEALATWTPDPAPRPWIVGGVRRGWMWRRKEIENYLLDPEVLARTFRWSGADRDRYIALLDELLAATAERTAARIALVGLLPQFDRRVVRPFDPALHGDALEAALRERHRRAAAAPRFSEDELVARFHALRPLCLPGGPGYSPWVVAGKDLLGAIARTRAVRERFPALVVPDRLTAAVVAALQADPGCARWLPEWAGLRGEVEDWLRGRAPA